MQIIHEEKGLDIKLVSVCFIELVVEDSRPSRIFFEIRMTIRDYFHGSFVMQKAEPEVCHGQCVYWRRAGNHSDTGESMIATRCTYTVLRHSVTSSNKEFLQVVQGDNVECVL